MKKYSWIVSGLTTTEYLKLVLLDLSQARRRSHLPPNNHFHFYRYNLTKLDRHPACESLIFTENYPKSILKNWTTSSHFAGYQHAFSHWKQSGVPSGIFLEGSDCVSSRDAVEIALGGVGYFSATEDLVDN